MINFRAEMCFRCSNCISSIKYMHAADSLARTQGRMQIVPCIHQDSCTGQGNSPRERVGDGLNATLCSGFCLWRIALYFSQCCIRAPPAKAVRGTGTPSCHPGLALHHASLPILLAALTNSKHPRGMMVADCLYDYSHTLLGLLPVETLSQGSVTTEAESRSSKGLLLKGCPWW